MSPAYSSRVEPFVLDFTQMSEKKDEKKDTKIRIGYVLKSADVGTLFSSRHSENSSQAHTRRHPHTFTHTCAHQCTPAHTAHPCAYPHTT